MEYKKMKDTIYLRVDKEENVTETIKEVCKHAIQTVGAKTYCCADVLLSRLYR